MEVVLGISFLSFNNINVKFAELEKLTWRSYIAAKALPITNRVKIINKKKFAKAALNKNFETFVIYVAALEVLTAMSIYLSRVFQV